MKINLLIAVIFFSFTLLAYSGLFQIHETERIGSTELNGTGCVCHSLYEDPAVKVWIEGPETLAVGKTALYKMYLTGGPAEAGGYNVAGKYGTMKAVDTISRWDSRAPNELTQAFPLIFSTPQDTISWSFEYTVSDSSETDTIYSCGLSIVYDSIPDYRDVWAYGTKFPITITYNATTVDEIKKELNNNFELNQNYPNPFNPFTVISYNVAVGSHITLKVYDIIGSELAVLVDEIKVAGKYEVTFNASNLSSGLYFYKLETSKFSEVKKMLLLR